jgi:hypothetical protein
LKGNKMETKLGHELTTEERAVIEKTGHTVKERNSYFFENGVYRRHTAEYRPSTPLKQYTQDEILHMPNGDETDMRDGFRIGLTSDTHLPYCIAGRIGKEKTIMFLPDPSPAYSTPQEAIAWQLHGCGYITDRELDDLLAQ